MHSILTDNSLSQKITYTLIDTDSWTATRASLCTGLHRILSQKENWDRYDITRQPPLHDGTGPTRQPKVCIDYRPSDKTASRMQLGGQFLINLANLLSSCPRAISVYEEDEVLQVFASVLGMIEEQIALYRQHTSLLKCLWA